MQLRLHGTSADDCRTAGLDELLDEHLPGERVRGQIGASDMDLTMVLSDTGALTFVRYLQSDDFYAPEPDAFAQTFMPNLDVGGTSTHAFLRDCASGVIDVGERDRAAVLDSWQEIVATYAPLRALRQRVGGADPQVRQQTLAFARKVVAFDGLLIRLKNRHPDAAVSNRLAKAFTRYRLYSGQDPALLDDTIRQLLALDPEHPERFLPFPVGDAVSGHTDQRIVVNRPIQTVLGALNDRYDLDTKVVTASPEEVARAIVRHSAYATMIDTDSDTLLTTRLERCPQGRLTGRLDGEMMAGIRKRQLLQEISLATERQVLVALGDLPGSDGQMGALALQNGGVFVIAHRRDHFDESRRGFDAALEKILGRKELDDAGDRIWYVEDDVSAPTKG